MPSREELRRLAEEDVESLRREEARLIEEMDLLEEDADALRRLRDLRRLVDSGHDQEAADGIIDWLHEHGFMVRQSEPGQPIGQQKLALTEKGWAFIGRVSGELKGSPTGFDGSTRGELAGGGDF